MAYFVCLIWLSVVFHLRETEIQREKKKDKSKEKKWHWELTCQWVIRGSQKNWTRGEKWSKHIFYKRNLPIKHKSEENKRSHALLVFPEQGINVV